jgi:hypothetical protein
MSSCMHDAKGLDSGYDQAEYQGTGPKGMATPMIEYRVANWCAEHKAKIPCEIVGRLVSADPARWGVAYKES